MKYGPYFSRLGTVCCLTAGLLALSAIACEQAPPETRSAGEACVVTSECESNLCYEATCLEPERDDDRDGLTNTLESRFGTDPFSYDTDNDGISDFHEIPNLSEPADEDGDLVIDALESLIAETGADGGDSDKDCLTDQKDPDNAVSAPKAEIVDFRNRACCCFGQCDKFGVTENKEVVAGGGDPIEVLSANDCTDEVRESGELGCVLNHPWVNADDDGDGIDNACDPCPSFTGWLDDDYPNDSDKDSVWDCEDNCPPVEGQDTWNGADPVTGVQADTDGDGVGDACDPNIDGDAYDNEVDNCPYVPNPQQGDVNGDGLGDACDPLFLLTDIDGDGTPNLLDCAPEDAAFAATSCGAANTCGDNGCGGVCGTCLSDEACIDEVCVATCAPLCAAGTVCGDDGCGGSCGACPGDEVCTEGQCAAACVPACDGKACGDDGCGDTCGGCGDAEVCTDDGLCEVVCTPNCGAGVGCGDDGCGGSCGTCDDGDACTTDSCDGGVCAYLAVTCEDFGVCKTATCDAAQGCVYTPQPGLPCEDGDATTFEETCDGNGACTALPCDPACEDGLNCISGVCDSCTSIDSYPYDDVDFALWTDDPVVDTFAVLESGEPLERSLCPTSDTDWFSWEGIDAQAGVYRLTMTSAQAMSLGADVKVTLHRPFDDPTASVLEVFYSQSSKTEDHLMDELINLSGPALLQVETAEAFGWAQGLDSYSLELSLCVPDCQGKVCGGDGCGGDCGACDDGNPCTTNGCSAGGAACLFEDAIVGTVCEDLACDDTLSLCEQQGACNSGLCTHPERMTCAQSFEFLDGCPYDPENPGQWEFCTQSAVTTALPGAVDDVAALADCIQTNGCFGAFVGPEYEPLDRACLAGHCASEYAACHYETQGEQSCGAVHHCASACDETPNCEADCLGQGSADAQEGYTEWALCKEAYCPEGADIGTCAQALAEHCTGSLKDCLAPVQGDDGCALLDECLATCTADGWGCDAECWQEAFSGAQEQMAAWTQCLDVYCTGSVSADATAACEAEASSAACAPFSNLCLFGSVCGDCDDADPCTIDSCDTTQAQCLHAAFQCDDGDACTAAVCVEDGCGTEPLTLPGCPACAPMFTSHLPAVLPSVPSGDVVFRGAVAWIATESLVCAHSLENLHSGEGDAHLSTIEGEAAQLERFDQRLTVATGAVLRVYDVTQLESPIEAWSNEYSSVVMDLDRQSGGLAVLLGDRVWVYQIAGNSELQSPEEILFGASDHRLVAFKGQDQVVVVREAESVATLALYGTSDANQLGLTGTPVTLVGSKVFDLEVQSNVAYLATNHGLERVDLGNDPTYRDGLALQGGSFGLFLIETQAFVSGNQQAQEGLHVIDISEDGSLTSKGFFHTGSQVTAASVATHQGVAYVMASDGVRALTLGCGEDCGDSLDNDNDSLVDCADPECVGDSACPSCELDPLPTPGPVEEGEEPADVTTFCYEVCNDMTACSYDLLGGAPSTCIFPPNPCALMDACEPECVAEVTADPRTMTSWRCRADVALTGVCPAQQVTTWETPEVCQLPEGDCPLYDSGCNAWCAAAQGCASVALDTQGTLDSRIGVFQYEAPICELTCSGHALFNASFGLFTQCLATALDSESCGFSDLTYQACEEFLEAECGNGSVLTGVEECDDNNTTTEACAYGEIECMVCNASCQLVAGETSYCGDGALDADEEEECDDGNTADDDTCSNACIEQAIVTPKIRIRLESEPIVGGSFHELRVYVTDLREAPTGVEGLEFALFAGAGGYIKAGPPDDTDVFWTTPYDVDPSFVADLPKDALEAQGGHLSFPLIGVTAGDVPVGAGEFLVLTMTFDWSGSEGVISSQASTMSIEHSMKLFGEPLPVSAEEVEFGSVDLFP